MNNQNKQKSYFYQNMNNQVSLNNNTNYNQNHFYNYMNNNDTKRINDYFPNNNNKNQNNYNQNSFNNQLNKNNQYNQRNNNDINQNNQKNNDNNNDKNNSNYEQNNSLEKNNKQNFDDKQNENNNKLNEVILKEKRHKPELSSSYRCSIINYSSTIDRNESNIIKSIVEFSYVTTKEFEKQSLSSIINEKIKGKLGGKWFVFVYKIDQPILFNISYISYSDLLIIRIGDSEFKIAKLDY